MKLPIFTCVVAILTMELAFAEDWPTYLRDNSRLGVTEETLALPLSPAWTIEPSEVPEKAWPGPDGREFEGRELQARNTFDDAFHVAVVDGRLFYGSSVDHQVHCVDLASGETIWSFFTEGPVRLAPTFHDGKIYVGSDDGYAYCLDAADGALVWKLHPGPCDERILGRQQMVSRWPVRTGILVQPDAEHGAVAYFGAGVFPHENIYLLAVRASDGEVLWKIDNLSQESAGRNDLSPQGYLLATDDYLVVPSGRSLPAVFDRKTGKFLHKDKPSWRSTAGGVVGGTQALLADGQIYSWGAHHILAMDQKTGDVGFGWFAGRQLAISGDAAYAANGTEIAKLDRQAYAENSRVRHGLEMDIYSLNSKVRGAKEPEAAKMRAEIKEKQQKLDAIAEVGYLWKFPSPDESQLIVAGNQLISGGQNEVAIYDTGSGKKLWEAKVDGEVRGLAVADGRLVASTTRGDIVCFAPGESNAARIIDLTAKDAEPFPVDDQSQRYADAAETILKTTGIRRGFCLVLGNGEGRLAWELAKRSDLEIYAADPDAAKVSAARGHFADAGLYGTRVSIHQGDLDTLPFPNYFANLVVSDTQVATGRLPEGLEAQAIARFVKPLGGVICLGPDGDDSLKSWLAGTDLEAEGARIGNRDGLALLTRGPLPGAGSWSHQYGEPGNTACGYDYRVNGNLGVLWYGDPGEGKMVNRHDGAVGPLAINGRLFAQGEDRIMAYDAYNGLFLWERENPESIRTGVFQNQNPGNLVASDDSLFFMQGDECIELDAATGRENARHLLPEAARGGEHEWGFVAYQDGILFGTATVRKELDSKLKRRGRKTDDSTDGIFAIDVATGKHLWHYHGRTIEHQTVAIGDDAVYFIDSSITPEERQAILHQDKSRFQNLTAEEARKAEAELKNQDVRLAVALNARSGETMWEEAVDVTDCSEIGTGGGKLTLLFRNNVLVLCGANANGHYWKQFISGEFSQRRLLALNADNGEKLWVREANYRHRPIIVNDEIIAEPWAFDLYSGKQKTRTNPLTGDEEVWSLMRSGHHCGMLAGSPNLLTFRSGFTGFYDLSQDAGTEHFAGHRTGCWINAIPANGLVSIPESSAGCVCLFSISSTIVMEPRPDRDDWAIFSSIGAKTPVKDAAFNFGAPGDRRDDSGRIWLAYPRPAPERETSLNLDLDFAPVFAKGGGWESRNPESAPVNAKDTPPWIYTSWADGLTHARIPLLGENDPPAKYVIRVHFAAPGKSIQRETTASSTEPRHFSLRLQGETVLEDVAVADGARDAQVFEFDNIDVSGALEIEMAAKSPDRAPVLNAIEVHRQGS
ncbi:MAG: PQQ-binding-like beta-propeller repeat protein [Verrucomicrobiae bacterium]|nr:PQQ-binding-like beta-propeller repeat protein [Verrucomicrobiae bacterium]